MLHTVEIRHIGTDLADAMAEKRAWLHHRRVKIAAFEYSIGGPGITFRIVFDAEADATAFAEAFKGCANNGLPPEGEPLWCASSPPRKRQHGGETRVDKRSAPSVLPTFRARRSTKAVDLRLFALLVLVIMTVCHGARAAVRDTPSALRQQVLLPIGWDCTGYNPNYDRNLSSAFDRGFATRNFNHNFDRGGFDWRFDRSLNRNYDMSGRDRPPCVVPNTGPRR